MDGFWGLAKCVSSAPAHDEPTPKHPEAVNGKILLAQGGLLLAAAGVLQRRRAASMLHIWLPSMRGSGEA